MNRGALLELSPNQVKKVVRLFENASADSAGGSTKTFYTKIFAVNNNPTTTLTLANIVKQADPATLYSAPAGALDFALCTALNDTATAANRTTLPTGIGSFSSGAAPQTTAVPSPQNLPSGAPPNSAGAQGIWLRLTLPAGKTAAKGSATMRATGSTT